MLINFYSVAFYFTYNNHILALRAVLSILNLLKYVT